VPESPNCGAFFICTCWNAASHMAAGSLRYPFRSTTQTSTFADAIQEFLLTLR